MRLWVFRRHFSTIFQLYIDLWATFPGANMVHGRNTLGYLRNRTFYIPERKYAYKYICMHRLQNVWHVHLGKCKKNLLISTLTSDQIVGLRECWLSNLSTFGQQYSRIHAHVIVVKNGGCNTSYSKQKLRISSLFPILLKYQRKICQPSGFSNSRKLKKNYLLFIHVHSRTGLTDSVLR